ncbi:MAG: hypothetical protein ACRCSG_05555 [Cellulosilyticaceae bacterium]
MKNKVKFTEGLLIDIAEDVLKLEIVKSIFSRLKTSNEDPIKKDDVPTIKYISLMYDKNSPIKKETIDNRKIIAAENAQFKNKSDEKDAQTLNTNRVVAMVHLFLKHQNDFRWSTYITATESFWQNQQVILKGASDPKEQETINKLAKANDETIDRIEKYQDQIFGDNKERMAEIINFSVEDYVKALESVQ